MKMENFSINGPMEQFPQEMDTTAECTSYICQRTGIFGRRMHPLPRFWNMTYKGNFYIHGVFMAIGPVRSGVFMKCLSIKREIYTSPRWKQVACKSFGREKELIP